LFNKITFVRGNRNSGVSVLALGWFALLAGGCGFHLQGDLTIPAEMKSTYIDAPDRYSLFYRELYRQLQSAGVELINSPVEATAILSIVLDETDQRVLSVSARNVPTEYEVYYSVQYSLASGEKLLLDTQNVTLTRDYTYDDTLVLGKAHEEDEMRDAIVGDLVNIVLRQISAL
jgi:LPS-assembly lipoprotein